MSKISKIHARQILDSRGYPTIEVILALEDGTVTKSSSPSGFSKSTYEAHELRDQDNNVLNGLGVEKAQKNVNDVIAPKLVGFDVREQQAIDKTMIDLDGSSDKSNLGVNALLPVSQAVAKAGAKVNKVPLYSYIGQFTGKDAKKMPVPLFNILEGGTAGTLSFREFLVVPASSKKFLECMTIGSAIYHSVEKLLLESNKGALSAREGGFSPVNIHSHQEAVDLLKEGINATSHSFSFDVFLGIDCGATSFLESDKYRLRDRPEIYEPAELANLYQTMVNDSSIIYLEDPFAEDDIESWKKLQSLGGKVLLVGDDLVATNPFRLQTAVSNKIVGGVIVKPSQIGTVSECIALVEIAKFTGLKVIVSHRTNETEDSFIADFAVGAGADYVKFGAPARERVVKYNRLLEIEEEISSE